MSFRITAALSTAALATALVAAPASAAPPKQPCDPFACPAEVLVDKVKRLAGPTVDDVVWTVRCVGDALGGNACHG